MQPFQLFSYDGSGIAALAAAALQLCQHSSSSAVTAQLHQQHSCYSTAAPAAQRLQQSRLRQPCRAISFAAQTPTTALQPCSLAALQPCSLAAMQPCSRSAVQPFSFYQQLLPNNNPAVLQQCSSTSNSSLAALNKWLTVSQSAVLWREHLELLCPCLYMLLVQDIIVGLECLQWPRAVVLIGQ